MKGSNRLFSVLPASLLTLLLLTSAIAQTTPQVPLPGKNIAQFVDPLPSLDVIVANASQIELRMQEFQTSVMPTGFVPANGQPYSGTWVWGYLQPNQNARASFLGPIVVATRGQATEIKWVNNLGSAGTSNVLAWLNGSDRTLHWADPFPLMGMTNHCSHSTVPGMPPMAECATHYDGPIPAVVHLHGGEVPAEIDGGPDAWFTSDGASVGPAYYSRDGLVPKNYAIYRYPNQQEAAPIWFHDHTLGATRLGVYAGLAGGYLITDPTNAPPDDLGDPTKIIPLIIQDRAFDTNGQLYFVNTGLNPEHPFWMPELVGDTILVNGKVWPYLEVQPRRYHFLVINGSNARTYEMFLTNPVTKVNGPSIWQVGTDGGYLQTAVEINPNAPKGTLNRLLLMPGERADIVIDFSALPAGTTLLLKNTAKTPFPAGAAPQGNTVGSIMQFRVRAGTTNGIVPLTYNPKTTPAIRTKNPIVRLVNAANGTLNAAPTVIRQLTLNEVMGMPMTATLANGATVAYPGGPLEILLNNSKWDATTTESVQEGRTELWEIVNLTADAHPIHTHLTQFQLLSRQPFNASAYTALYNAAFPSGVFEPAAGPPLDYSTGNPRALGGNPDVTPFLRGVVALPNPNEAGWKDTVVTYPREVTRFVVRYAPTDLPTNSTALFYPFDPGGDANATYVWHCHIIDHEDNEMMRRLTVNPSASAERAFVKGADY